MGLSECRKVYAKIAEEKKSAAIHFLKKEISEDIQQEIRKEIAKDPESWFASYHFSWGMGIRNALRATGLGEEYFKINNLDDIYVELVEDAVRKDNE